MGLTLHRTIWVTTPIFGTPTVSFLDQKKGKEKIAPLTITSLDLSIVDNKIAMLHALDGTAQTIVAEPNPKPKKPEGWVDYVIKEMLKTHLPGQFSKSIEKDLIVIKSLANLHEVYAKKNMVIETLSKGLPEPMKSYDINSGKKS